MRQPGCRNIPDIFARLFFLHCHREPLRGNRAMSFTGTLDYLPIVDVIQLLHAARKSGILRVKSRKRESNLVFKDGCIVSASHVNNSIRIGTILIERNIITPEILDQTLREQVNAGPRRKPLIIMLLDKGAVKEEDAYQGLEHLIEKTVVDILTWKKGTFTMEGQQGPIVDKYRYYPGKISREIRIDAQGVLMDALRVFDEKVRDGELTEEIFPDYDDNMMISVPFQEGMAHSADDLSLMRLKPERVDREEKNNSRYCASCRALLMQEKDLKPPPEPVINFFIPYIGWGFVLVGVAVLACGMKGLYDYRQIQPAVDELTLLDNSPGPFRLYLTNGLLPSLQAFVGMFAAIAGYLYLQMWSGARKTLMGAAWCCIALAVTSELVNFIASIRASSSRPSLYYLVEFIGFITMTIVWTVPLLALIWFLRRDTITVSSSLGSNESVFKPYRRFN
jgi:hypothetical protein